MRETVNYTCRIDPVIKKKSELLYASLGMNLSTAINVFLRESLQVGGLPFEVRIKQPEPAAEPAEPVLTEPAEIPAGFIEASGNKKKKKGKK